MLRQYFYNLVTGRKRGIVASGLRFFLILFSFIYATLIRLLIFFYSLKPRRLGCKVISVGNITWGGTGKTPCVEYLVRCLKQDGRKVAILSRGYKRNPRIKSQEQEPTYETMGDEPYMLARVLGDTPVIVDSNRVRAADTAIRKYKADTVVLDDGFQQWQIKKDLEIVTIDSANPFGNRMMIPAGILREPLSSLKRSDVLVLTKTNINPHLKQTKEFLLRVNPSCIIAEAGYEPAGFYNIAAPEESLEPNQLRSQTVTLLSGIADPDSFEMLMTNIGIKIGLSFKFADHHCYSRSDLDKVIAESRQHKIDTIVTTEKDAVRLEAHVSSLGRSQIKFLVLRIELKVNSNEEGLRSRLRSLYSI